MRASLVALLFAGLIVAAVAGPCDVNLPVSSVYAISTQDGYPPTNVLDNNYDPESRWSAKGQGVFITFDLGSAKSVCSASVAWWKSAERVNSFVLSVSTDNVTFTQVLNGQSVISSTDTLQVYGFSTVTARYVRLTFNGNTVSLWASVIEMRANGLTPTAAPTRSPTTAPTRAPTASPTRAPTPKPATHAPSGFVHPGILVSASQIAFVKAKIQAGLNPWANQLARMKSSRYSTMAPGDKNGAIPTYLACGSGSWSDAHPDDPINAFCTVARDNGQAAWVQALLWQYTGDITYANRAKAILNAWKNKLTEVKFVATNTQYSNGVLQAAWMMEYWPRAAELLRYGPASGWSAADAADFGAWCTRVFVPLIYNGWGTNNWMTSCVNGLVNVAVYNNNRTLFDKALTMYQKEVPTYIYLTSDGPTPANYRPADWKNPNTLPNGLAMETCRDAGHTQFAFASMIYVAETARIQGAADFYTQYQTRFTTSFEFHAYFLNLNTDVAPSWLCNGHINFVGYLMPTWEIYWNRYHNVKGLALGNTSVIINKLRASGPFAQNLQMGWEGITHGDVFNA